MVLETNEHTLQKERNFPMLRIPDIDDPKISQKLTFLGIDINVFMGDLSTLSLSLVLVAALFRHLEGPKEIHKQTHMVNQLFIASF